MVILLIEGEIYLEPIPERRFIENFWIWDRKLFSILVGLSSSLEEHGDVDSKRPHLGQLQR